MIFEKNKVYKIYHNPSSFGEFFPRDYLLVCPKNDLVLGDGFLKGKKYWYEAGHFIPRYNVFPCIFVVGFDGLFSIDCNSSICEDCYTEELNEYDLKNIRDILQYMAQMGERYKYNRKLNKIIQYENN
jgi:hypothetical protein